MAPKVGEKGPAKKGPAKKAADGKAKKKKVSKAETYKIYIYSERLQGVWGVGGGLSGVWDCCSTTDMAATCSSSGQLCLQQQSGLRTVFWSRVALPAHAHTPRV
jgi:hypothetical protein